MTNGSAVTVPPVKVVSPAKMSPIISVTEPTTVIKSDVVSPTVLDSVASPTNGEHPKPTTDSKYASLPKCDTESIRALLVEDNEINLRLLIAYMRKLKLSHLAATNGLEALETYKSNNGRFDVVFMGNEPPSLPRLDYLLSFPFYNRYIHAHNVWY